MSKFISDKIIAHGEIIKDGTPSGEYVIIRGGDYPVEPGMRRTTYFRSDLKTLHVVASRGQFDCGGYPGDDRSYVGVELEKLKEFRPAWCHTREDLLAQYEAMQREDGSGPIKSLDLRKDPELLTMAKKFWAEKLASKTK